MLQTDTTAEAGPILVDVLPPEQLQHLFTQLGRWRLRRQGSACEIRADVRAALTAAQQGSQPRHIAARR